MRLLILATCLVAGAMSQNIGTLTAEQPLPISVTVGGQQQTGGVVMDANWRWTHTTSGYTNCYTGNLWDAALCPDPDTCTSNCAIDGVSSSDWSGTYGATTSGNALTLKFVTQGAYSKNVGSRTYLLDSSNSKYHMFKLMNQEFTFDVDVSNLECGLNGALYFVEMDEDGGAAKYPTNKGGAKYGTGYCDAQCPHDVKWIDGKSNSKEWKASPVDENSGVGHYGTCCAEMDIWEANKYSQAYTSHPCSVDGQTQCEGSDCGDNTSGDRYKGVCDKDGCDFASYRLGDHTFYGPGSSYKLDTTQPITVVTQFISTDGTANGDLKEIRRLYKQNGQTIQNSKVSLSGVTQYDSITDEMCSSTKGLFGDINDHENKGGIRKMGAAIKKGMVLVMSLWDDHDAHMLWLDSNYPTDADASKPGIARGPCSTSSGNPVDVESQYASASVKFSNIKVGNIGSTY